MKRMSFNRLRNARIKNIALGLLCILPILFLWPRILNNHSEPNKINFITIFGIPYLVMGLLLLLPFQQVIESTNDVEFRTYLQIGWLKVNVKTYSKQSVKQILLEQDKNKFFCLTVKIANQEDWVIEKHPTCNIAEERLDELQSTIG